MTLSVYRPALWVWLRVLVGLALFAAGWTAQGWRKDARIQSLRADHAKVLADIATATEKTQRAVRQYEQAANSAISTADKTATERIAKNEEETSRLRECVRLGTCGVRIVTRVVREPGGSGAADPSASSLGDAAVELDQDVQQRVLDLRESVQLDAEKLDYLQRYAEACRKAWAHFATREETWSSP